MSYKVFFFFYRTEKREINFYADNQKRLLGWVDYSQRRWWTSIIINYTHYCISDEVSPKTVRLKTFSGLWRRIIKNSWWLLQIIYHYLKNSSKVERHFLVDYTYFIRPRYSAHIIVIITYVLYSYTANVHNSIILWRFHFEWISKWDYGSHTRPV